MAFLNVTIVIIPSKEKFKGGPKSCGLSSTSSHPPGVRLEDRNTGTSISSTVLCKH